MGDFLGILIALAILGIFILGIVSAFSLLGKLLGKLFAPSPPPKPAWTPHKPLAVPPGIAAPPRRAVPADMPRVEFLLALEREINRGFYSGQISTRARTELLQYVEQQRATLGASAGGGVGAQAQAQPQRGAGAEEQPLLDLLERGAPPETPATARAATPEVVAKPMRSPEEIRAAIAKLHTDAQAKPPPEQPAVVTAEASRPQQSAGIASTPLVPKIHAIPLAGTRVPPPKAAAKSLFERLATPENVRILQSVAICVIFISAAALVRTQMWSQASAWARMGFLLAGTAACVGLGFVLRLRTQLRIAGLGFLILGQLSLLLDTYAALITPGGASLYPYSPASLWTICFLAFTALAFWQAKVLQEPLLEAFTFFGGLAGWGSAALWSGIDEWLLPAAFVPAALICARLARWVRPGSEGSEEIEKRSEKRELPAVHGTAGGTPALLSAGGAPALLKVPRWSLPWWLEVGWSMGSGLLSVVVPVAAVLSGREHLASQYWCHALAIFALAAGLLVHAWRTGRTASIQASALLLLVPAPLAAYAFGWSWEKWPVMFALPGAFLVAVGLLCSGLVEVRREKSIPSADSLPVRGRAASGLGDSLAQWGLWSTLLGLVWAVCAELSDPVPALSVWSAGAGLAVGLAFAVLKRAAWGPWMAMACAAFLAALSLDLVAVSSLWWPAVWLALALAAYVAWAFADTEEVREHGRIAADVLGLASAGYLISFTPIFSFPAGTVVALSVAIGWAAAAAYALATSACEREPWRRGLGAALLSPALAYALYHAGLPLDGPAPWLALLAVLVMVLASVVEKREKNAALFHSAVCGGVVVIVHGIALACLQVQPLSAAQSFALLALALAAIATRLRVYWTGSSIEVSGASAILASSETAALFLLALAGQCVFNHLYPDSPHQAYASETIAVLIIAISMAAENVAALCARGLAGGAAKSGQLDQRPFHTAGGIVALLMTIWASVHLISPSPFVPRIAVAETVTATWCAALVPLFLSLRRNFERDNGSTKNAAVPPMAIVAGLFAGILALLAACRAIQAEFWLASCRAEVRGACTWFFAAAVAVSLLCGVRLKCAFAPIAGIAGLLGLTGCAYGAWQLPPESFGICCAMLVWMAFSLGEMAHKSEAWARTGVAAAAYFSGAAVAIFGGIYLLVGLSVWSRGHAQSWAVAAWLFLAAWAWSASARAGAATRGALAASLAAAAGLGLTVAGCHAMRWTNLDFAQFGPGLAATALILLALEEVAAYFAHSAAEEDQEKDGEAPQGQDASGSGVSPAWAWRLRGVMAAIVLTTFAGLCFGLIAATNSHVWASCLTLAETALLFVGLTVVARRSGQGLDWRVFLLEMGAWVLLALAIAAALSQDALNFPLSAAGWMLVAALFILVGMALESIVSALAPNREPHVGQQPVPFLASRHAAAFGLVALALLTALFGGDALSKEELHSTWRMLFSAAALALYGSFARCCTSETLAQSARKCSAFMAYVLLLPGGYLCLLCAHSTGSSWGALYFFALVPVLFAAAYVLERQKLAAQALQALLGSGLVSAGALVLAFIGNRARLAEVPCVMFLALVLELLVLRLWLPLEDSLARQNSGCVYSLGACLALIGSAAFGLRALAGWHAWGDPWPWAWQMPWLAVLGLAMTALGGVLRLECSAGVSPASGGRREQGRSLVALCGACLSVAALAFALIHVLYYGMRAPYLYSSNADYFDALVISIVLCSAACQAAGKWLALEPARYFVHAGVLAAYALCIWKQHPESWEWYSVPAALYLFLWAWQSAGEMQPTAAQKAARCREVNILLALASALALLPSFVQAVPQTPKGAWHFLLLVGVSLIILFGAMFARRKVPLLAGAGALILSILIKAVQWAHQREVIWPVAGIAFGLVVLAVAMLFEQRMNQAFRKAVDKARAEARMFWVSWE